VSVREREREREKKTREEKKGISTTRTAIHRLMQPLPSPTVSSIVHTYSKDFLLLLLSSHDRVHLIIKLNTSYDNDTIHIMKRLFIDFEI
jgi:hypothetical protein